MKLKKLLPRSLMHAFLFITMLIWILPTLGLLITSFRPREAVSNTGWWTVLNSPLKFTQFTLENYEQVIFSEGVGQAFFNSFMIAIPGTLIPLVIAAFAAFALAKLNFKGKGVFYAAVVGLLVIPLQMTFIPILKFFNSLGVSGTFPALWIAHTGYGLPLAVYMLHNFFSSLPDELFEAAFIDGASIWQTFTKLAVPLSLPAFASLFIFQFLWVWNDFLVALIFLGGTQDVAPITVKLSSLVGSHGQNWHLLTSAAFVSIVVPVIIFFSLQRYFVKGILAGSVKG